MIEELLGGKTAERTLLYIAAMGQGYPAEISRTFNMSNTQTQRTAERLENADILVSKNIGRTRVYQLNDKWYLATKLKALFDEALLYMPIDEQEIYFGKRQKPRKKNKRI
jgi:hypothetical protein